MSVVQGSDWDESFEWDDPGLQREQIASLWSKKPKDFRRKVERPRPSRLIKYLGVLCVLASLCWLGGLGFAVDHFWPGYLESDNAPLWQICLGCVVLFGPYLTLMLGGLWLWDKGAKRKRVSAVRG
jgi:hypothetical protein